MTAQPFAGDLCISGDPAVDDIVNSNPLALMIGMLLDQQISIELAFTGPSRLAERIDGPLHASTLASMSVDDVVAAFAEKPALHRFPASMAKRVHALASFLVEHHEGDPTLIWADAEDGRQLARRLKALPGFGPEKTKIFVAVLAKRFGVRPDGWQAAAGGFAVDDVPRSVADVTDPSVLDAIRAHRAAQKAAKGTVDKER